MTAPIFKHFTYHRGPLGAALSCNHCKYFLVMKGAKLPRGLVGQQRKIIGDHIRSNHTDKLEKDKK